MCVLVCVLLCLVHLVYPDRSVVWGVVLGGLAWV